jgi:hypothetical protein
MKESPKSVKKLEVIENHGFEMGNISYSAFIENQNISSLKGAVSAYRLSMQAIRDQSRYKVSTKKK